MMKPVNLQANRTEIRKFENEKREEREKRDRLPASS